MDVRIKETGKIEQLTYFFNGVDCAADMVCRTPYGVDDEGIAIMDEGDFAWWTGIFERLEKMDDCGIDWSEYANQIDYLDLADQVEAMEVIAEEHFAAERAKGFFGL